MEQKTVSSFLLTKCKEFPEYRFVHMYTSTNPMQRPHCVSPCSTGEPFHWKHPAELAKHTPSIYPIQCPLGLDGCLALPPWPGASSFQSRHLAKNGRGWLFQMRPRKVKQPLKKRSFADTLASLLESSGLCTPLKDCSSILCASTSIEFMSLLNISKVSAPMMLTSLLFYTCYCGSGEPLFC